MVDCKCALVCIAKDEDDYIQEWVDYHLKLGFSDIYIWQNNWKCNTLNQNEHVHLKTIDGDSKQLECYNTAINEIWNKYHWIAFFDVDEFLVINPLLTNYKLISQFLSQDKYNVIPSICVNWRIFGDSGKNTFDTFNVLERFILSDYNLEESSKPIIHTSLVHNTVKFYFNPHCITTYQFDPNLKFKLNGVGNNKYINNDGNQEPLELNHYRNKTFAERFRRQYKKPIADGNIEITKLSNNIKSFTQDFLFYNRNNVLNTTALDFKLR